jgi:hypothetical protein
MCKSALDIWPVKIFNDHCNSYYKITNVIQYTKFANSFFLFTDSRNYAVFYAWLGALRFPYLTNLTTPLRKTVGRYKIWEETVVIRALFFNKFLNSK